jgi:uncharacterized protein YraI
MYHRHHLNFLLVFLYALAITFSALVFAAPLRAAGEPAARVNVSQLNFRAGPGFSARVLRVLDQDQALTLVGRSADGVWLQARLPGGAEGWVYGSFVATEAALDRLPVTQAAGGPTAQPGGVGRRYSLTVSIADNQATVTAQRFAPNSDLTLSLSRADGSGSVPVAQGKTDAEGMAQFIFAMPGRWADGQPVRESALTLTARTADGKLSGAARLQYYR